MIDQPLADMDLGDYTAVRPRLVVDVWMGRLGDEAPEVLLLLRAPDNGGFWQGVSGRVEAVDATLAATAIREVREETGLAIARRDLVDLGRWTDFRSPFSGRWFRKRSLVLRLGAEVTLASLALSEEHVEARWTSLAEARALVRFEENARELADLARTLAGG